MPMSDNSDIIPLLERIATALERSNPPVSDKPLLGTSDGYVWEPKSSSFTAIDHINVLDLSLLQGIEQQKTTLLANSLQFANGFAANNALLWGAQRDGQKLTDQGNSQSRSGSGTSRSSSLKSTAKILIACRNACN